MTPNLGRVLEFRLEPDGRRAVRVGCEPGTIPIAGKYLLGDIPSDDETLLAVPLFAQAAFPDGFLAAPDERPLPASWEIGASLRLRGPLGKGFHLPGVTRNLALAAAGDTAARLLPLVEQAANAALFTDLPVPDLPTKVEVQPLENLRDALGWADFLAADIPLERLDELSDLLGGPDAGPVPPGQVLVRTEMPCGGSGDCGVCAVRVGRQVVLLCVEGPVIDLLQLLRS